MALDLTTFETIIPSRFISFTLPNHTRPTRLLRVAALDSPNQLGDPPRVAAIVVPLDRESDWVFSTESGHLQLLLASLGISRLVLIGDDPTDGPDTAVYRHDKVKDAQYVKSLETILTPLLRALSPKICTKDPNFEVPILEYDDNVASSVVLERCVGGFVGEMLVEDVEKEIELNGEEEGNRGKSEFKRRLRFKRMPNLVQSEIRIVPEKGSGLVCAKIGGEVGFRPDLGVLVQSYLIPMVASLSLIGSCIDDRIRGGFRPKALCLGVGGGSLLSFLRTQLGFEVFGVELDEEVLRVARKYFGLEDAGIGVCIGDAVKVLEKLATGCSMPDCFLNCGDGFDAKFDVIMVDLDCSDARNGGAPPREFVRRKVLLAAKSLLSDSGLLVVNVIPPSRSAYDTFVGKFRDVFHELYEIDVENGDHFVLVASVSPGLPAVGDCENSFIRTLRTVIFGKFLDSIKKI
ncbi:hypothetical protein Tsubulata_034608 [Turnera subulata]|uniref:PABS domain-containing protein n=1 Tax=Turnera subulata TaxID=218843 RepID=A0A9Q0JHG0_9ROSI|nr:hypothetical protein Tsubulata_044788 [Turnera subulata]KAJ4843771.1 hypothetical protein Tsubulata_034608 [Turnera subulata]